MNSAVSPTADDAQVSRLAKVLVPLVALVAVFFTLKGGETIVALLLMGYSFVTQLFPAAVLSLAHRNFATREGAAASASSTGLVSSMYQSQKSS